MTDEYAALLNALKAKEWTVVDCLRQSAKGGKGKHNPITFADYRIENGERVSAEPQLIGELDQCTGMSLDYIFVLETNGDRATNGLQVDIDATEVQKFEVLPEGLPFRHLSDHYGISTLLR